MISRLSGLFLVLIRDLDEVKFAFVALMRHLHFTVLTCYGDKPEFLV